MNCPYDVPENLIQLDVLCCNSQDVSFQIIDMVNPYEISGTTILDKKFIVFKEILYVSNFLFKFLNNFFVIFYFIIYSGPRKDLCNIEHISKKK